MYALIYVAFVVASILEPNCVTTPNSRVEALPTHKPNLGINQAYRHIKTSAIPNVIKSNILNKISQKFASKDFLKEVVKQKQKGELKKGESQESVDVLLQQIENIGEPNINKKGPEEKRSGGYQFRNGKLVHHSGENDFPILVKRSVQDDSDIYYDTAQFVDDDDSPFEWQESVEEQVPMTEELFEEFERNRRAIEDENDNRLMYPRHRKHLPRPNIPMESADDEIQKEVEVHESGHGRKTPEYDWKSSRLDQKTPGENGNRVATMESDRKRYDENELVKDRRHNSKMRFDKTDGNFKRERHPKTSDRSDAYQNDFPEDEYPDEVQRERPDYRDEVFDDVDDLTDSHVEEKKNHIRNDNYYYDEDGNIKRSPPYIDEESDWMQDAIIDGYYDDDYHWDDDSYHGDDDGYHEGDDSYHGDDDGYHEGDDSYHGGDDSYHEGNDSYHEGDDSYHGGDDSYHGGDDSYHEGDDSYHEGDDSYHGGGDSYHGGDDSYHGGDDSYHGDDDINSEKEDDYSFYGDPLSSDRIDNEEVDQKGRLDNFGDVDIESLEQDDKSDTIPTTSSKIAVLEEKLEAIEQARRLYPRLADDLLEDQARLNHLLSLELQKKGKKLQEETKHRHSHSASGKGYTTRKQRYYHSRNKRSIQNTGEMPNTNDVTSKLDGDVAQLERVSDQNKIHQQKESEQMEQTENTGIISNSKDDNDKLGDNIHLNLFNDRDDGIGEGQIKDDDLLPSLRDTTEQPEKEKFRKLLKRIRVNANIRQKKTSDLTGRFKQRLDVLNLRWPTGKAQQNATDLKKPNSTVTESPYMKRGGRLDRGLEGDWKRDDSLIVDWLQKKLITTFKDLIKHFTYPKISSTVTPTQLPANINNADNKTPTDDRTKTLRSNETRPTTRSSPIHEIAGTAKEILEGIKNWMNSQHRKLKAMRYAEDRLGPGGESSTTSNNEVPN